MSALREVGGEEAAIRATVIIPAYNAERYIARAITSALSQTEQRLEIIVIDDASADATAAIVAEMAASDGRVQLLRQAVNSGPGAARNRGLDLAHGDWVVLLDADDEFAVQERIEKLIELGDRHGADLVADDLLVQNEDKAAMTPMLMLSQSKWMSADEFVTGNLSSRRAPRTSYGFMQPILRRSFLAMHGLRFEESNRFGEDFLLYMMCLLRGARWWITPEPMYCYTVRIGSLAETQTAADLKRIKLKDEIWLRNDPMIASDVGLARAVRRHWAKMNRAYYYRAFTDAVKSRKFAEARRLVVESPRGLGGIVLVGLNEAPRIITKALRGGYRQTQVPVPAVPGRIGPASRIVTLFAKLSLRKVRERFQAAK